MVLPANNVADAQIDVVGARSEVVGGHAIGTEQRKILNVVGGFELFAVDGVMKANWLTATPRNPEAEREGFSGRGATVALGASEFAHPRIQQPGLTGAGFFAIAGMRRGKIAIRQAFLEKAAGDLAMQTQALGLLVLFVPPQVEPAQPLENRAYGRVGIALDIGVIQSQYHGSSIMAGIQPVKDECTGTANVQKTSRRRREADAKHNFRV